MLRRTLILTALLAASLPAAATAAPRAPATPSSVAVRASGATSAVVSWDAAKGAARYRILSGGRTVRDTKRRSLKVALGTGPVRYQIVAINRSGRLSRRSRTVTVLPSHSAPRAPFSPAVTKATATTATLTWGKSKAVHARVASYSIVSRGHTVRSVKRPQRPARRAPALAHADLPRRRDRLARLGLQAFRPDHRDHRAQPAGGAACALGHRGRRHHAVTGVEPPEDPQGVKAARVPRAARRPRRLAGRGQERQSHQPRTQVGPRLVGCHRRHARLRVQAFERHADPAAGPAAHDRCRARLHARLDGSVVHGLPQALHEDRRRLSDVLRLQRRHGRARGCRQPSDRRLRTGPQGQGAAAVQLPEHGDPARDPHRSGDAHQVARRDRRVHHPVRL